MKLTRKSVANSSRSCGRSIRLHHRRRDFDHCRRGRLARLPIPGGQEGCRGGCCVRKPSSSPSRTSIPRRKPRSPSSLPRRRRAIARWRGCAPQRKRARSAGGGETVQRHRGRSHRRRAEQDLAQVRAAGLLLETAPYPKMLQRLEPVTAPGTYRHTARELLALSAWRANDAAAARQWLDMMANDGETPRACVAR